MTQTISQLKPTAVWKNFAALNSIPRPSKHEEKIIQFMMDFGQKLGLDTSKDAVGNVRILKPATAGMENHQTVCLQSHLDMVCQKNNDTQFDFDTQGIEMYVDGDFVKAKGTTLGADNGIGVAAIMGILESTDIAHPPLVALFTVDEETGMTGAKNLQPGWIQADILLNLDTEEDDELDIGCAGGIDVSGEKKYTLIDTPKENTTYKLEINGLQGGHSGSDIHKGFGNANKVLGNILFQLKENILIQEVNGGGLRNAIPREATAFFSSNNTNIPTFVSELIAEAKKELKDTELDMEITCSAVSPLPKSLNQEDSVKFSDMLKELFNGVYNWSKSMPDLVQTSNNVARIVVKDGQGSVQCLCRSSDDRDKMVLANKLKSDMEKAGYTVTFSGDYPGWEPNPNSEILKLMKSVYEKEFHSEPKVVSIHAGLECGLIGKVYPNMEMISFGPNIFGAHSPDERAQISSVDKFWNYLTHILKAIPESKK